jgi:hypothetical protein
MRKIAFLLIFIFLISSCSVPDISETKFIDTIDALDTPKAICNYMEENFVYDLPYNANNIEIDDQLVRIYPTDPYTFWQYKKGLCLDFADFGIFAANYHGYKTYLIKIFFKDSPNNHYLVAYKENGFYSYSSNQYYYQINASTFQEIIDHYFNIHVASFSQIYDISSYKLDSYEVYDYNLNKIAP